MRVAPEEVAGEHRRKQHGEENRAQQGKGHGPGHGVKQPSLHVFQGENGKIGGDDDGDGVEDGALHFMRGLADGLRQALIRRYGAR